MFERTESPFYRGFAADVQSTRLIVGAVRCTGDFTELATVASAGHPGFDVELAIGRATEISRGGIDHAVVNAKSLEDLFFDTKDLSMQGVGIFQVRPGVTEHFHLCKLVDSVDSLASSTSRSGFGSEAV